MPSGAKKRKAAKKKKEQGTSTNSNSNNNNNISPSTNNTSSLGNDDPKSQDERESDGSEVVSPVSQDHQNHPHLFKERNGESQKRDPSPVRSFDTENKPMEEVARDVEGTEKGEVEDDDAAKVERKLKSEEDSENQNVSIMHVEFVKESHDGNSSSSSSDDESQVVEKKSKEATDDSILEATLYNGENKLVDSFPKQEIQDTEKASSREADNSIVNTAAVCEPVKLLVTASAEVIHVKQSDSVENSVVADVVESKLKRDEESKRNDEKVFPLLEEKVEASSTGVETVENGNDGKILPTSGAPIAETGDDAENVRDSKISASSENQPLIASAPRVAERTSWMSCCGLFDVLRGSS